MLIVLLVRFEVVELFVSTVLIGFLVVFAVGFGGGFRGGGFFFAAGVGEGFPGFFVVVVFLVAFVVLGFAVVVEVVVVVDVEVVEVLLRVNGRCVVVVPTVRWPGWT